MVAAVGVAAAAAVKLGKAVVAERQAGGRVEAGKGSLAEAEENSQADLGVSLEVVQRLVWEALVGNCSEMGVASFLRLPAVCFLGLAEGVGLRCSWRPDPNDGLVSVWGVVGDAPFSSPQVQAGVGLPCALY